MKREEKDIDYIEKEIEQEKERLVDAKLELKKPRISIQKRSGSMKTNLVEIIGREKSTAEPVFLFINGNKHPSLAFTREKDIIYSN